MEWLTAPEGVLAFRRGDFVCVANTTTGAPVTVPAYGRVLITSGEVEETGGEAVVAADTTVWWD
ncbi:Glycoside hydrolase family 13 protein OS=Streptomyces tendae OX=1932 GN=F3L20_24740 PE=4 SV=1 [Streptomyces tendae]